MGKTKNTDEANEPVYRPALTLEARENQMINLAVDLAEQQLRDGTASSQVISHFLKLATVREQMEQKAMEKQIELMEAKIESLKSTQRTEELYANALEAMRRYSGNSGDD